MWMRGICLALIVSFDAQAASCPPFPVGVVAVGDVFHATAGVEALRSSQDSLELAIAEASLASRLALQGEKSAPKTSDGHLQGVTQAVCVVGRKAYVTSSVSRTSAAQAEKLRAMLNQSHLAAPAPLPMHYVGR
jgi:hypothetical protein